MNTDIKRGINVAVEDYGFYCRRNSFFRIRNDVVQGFCFKEKRLSRTQLISLNYAVYPLCNPYSNYHRFSFERREIGMLMPSFSLWPFSYEKSSTESRNRCLAEIIRGMQEYLIPYFDLYDTCAKASCGIPELAGHNGAVLDAVYFALKAEKKKAAVDGLRAILQQHATVLVENKDTLPPELSAKIEERSRREDTVFESLLVFIQTASSDEIKHYLRENEQSGTKDLLHR